MQRKKCFQGQKNSILDEYNIDKNAIFCFSEVNRHVSWKDYNVVFSTTLANSPGGLNILIPQIT